jgi:hypothetical protein
VGIRVSVTVGKPEPAGALVFVGSGVDARVLVGLTVPVGEMIKVGDGVVVGVRVMVGVVVIVAVGVIVGVGGVPVTEKNPLTFQVSPTNNCTSY